MKQFLKIFSINLFVFFFLLGASEFLVRIFFPQIQLPGTDSSLIKENVFYTSPGLSPNAEGVSKSVLKVVDSQGFWKYRSQTGSSSVLFLGDSVTMGIGTENDSTYAGIVNNYSDQIRVLNPSLIGYSSSDYLNIIKKLILENDNQLGISGVYLFWCLNDVYDNYGNKNAPGFGRDYFVGKVMSFIRSNSKFYLFLKKTFTDRPKAYINFDRQFYRHDNPQFKQAIHNLKEIDSIVKESGINLQVIILPYEYQLRNFSDQEAFLPQEILADSLKSFGIISYDFSDSLTHLNSESLYHYGDGIHFSNKGHRLIAQELIESFFK